MPSARMDSILGKIREFLHQDNVFSEAFAIVEKKTGVDRAYVALGIGATFTLYMIFGYFAALLCNLVGFVFPAYQSIKAIETMDKKDDMHWLTYWVVFALFSVMEFFIDRIMSWFPFYWLAKVVFIGYLFMPQTRGAELLYRKWIQPLATKYMPRVDSTVRDIQEAGMNGFAHVMTEGGDHVHAE